jgi:hypothetical protein
VLSGWGGRHDWSLTVRVRGRAASHCAADVARVLDRRVVRGNVRRTIAALPCVNPMLVTRGREGEDDLDGAFGPVQPNLLHERGALVPE